MGTGLGIGNEAKDRVTGFRGVITAICEYLTGCRQFLVQPGVNDGKFVEARWFDETRLEYLGPALDASTFQAERGGDVVAPVK